MLHIKVKWLIETRCFICFRRLHIVTAYRLISPNSTQPSSPYHIHILLLGRVKCLFDSRPGTGRVALKHPLRTYVRRVSLKCNIFVRWSESVWKDVMSFPPSCVEWLLRLVWNTSSSCIFWTRYTTGQHKIKCLNCITYWFVRKLKALRFNNTAYFLCVYLPERLDKCHSNLFWIIAWGVEVNNLVTIRYMTWYMIALQRYMNFIPILWINVWILSKRWNILKMWKRDTEN